MPVLHSRTRSAIVLLCLWAFAVQAYITQTHFHAPASAAFAAAGHGSSAVDQPGEGQGGEPACVLCKIALHGNAVAFVPHPMALAAPQAPHAALTDPASVPIAAASSHHWRSRGPPLI